MQGNGTITLRKQVELFAETKATIIRTGLVDRERLDDLLAQSLFLISTGGNDFNAFDDALLENGPSVLAIGTNCCCSRYRWYPLVPAATAAGTFGRRPNMWRAIGTGWWFQPVPMRHHRNRFDPPPGTK